MSAPLPAAAFPIGGKGGAVATFVVAVMIGLAIYTASTTKPKSPTSL